MGAQDQDPTPKWRERFQALRNIPPIFSIVWQAAPSIIVGSLICRVLAGLLPLAALAVTKAIINDIVAFTTHKTALPPIFWWLVALEFVLASLAGILVRLINFCDFVLSDRYSRHISTKIMAHAAKLDLTSFEDPLFYDKMERARVQGTDRIIMIQSSGLMVQQIVTTISFAGSILLLSPWILLPVGKPSDAHTPYDHRTLRTP